MGIVRRAAARFALVGFALYHVPLFLNDFPSFGGGGFGPDGLAHAWGHVFGQVGLWVARQVFGLTGAMPHALDGDNGDTAEEYCRLLVAIIVAAIAAAMWTLADRRRPRGRWVEETLRVLLRYSIVLGLASYAIAKLIPVQFQPLDGPALERHVGELSPMQLLWSSMRYSRAYSMFGGIMEMTAIMLLCFRRTTLIGALMCVPVMSTVAMMNFCYGVPVKLFSSMMLLSALVLIAFDARRLIDFFVLHRATPAAEPAASLLSPRFDRARWIVKAIVVGGVLASSIVEMVRIQAAPDQALAGRWEVTSFVRTEHDLATPGDPTRWRRLAITRLGAAIRLESDAMWACRASGEPPTLALACDGDHEAKLTWQLAGSTLSFDGTLDGLPIAVVLERRDESRLVDAPFRWIIE